MQHCKSSWQANWKAITSLDDKALPAIEHQTKEQAQITKLTHKTICDVKDEFEKMGFNRAIAKIREFSNALEKFEVKNTDDKKIMHFALTTLVKLFAPIMPHLAEECFAQLGFKGFVAQTEFPEFNANLIKEDAAKIAVQVLGKLRAVIELPKGASQESAQTAALAHENVAKFLEGKAPKKIIFVQDKLLNFVV